MIQGWKVNGELWTWRGGEGVGLMPWGQRAGARVESVSSQIHVLTSSPLGPQNMTVF